MPRFCNACRVLGCSCKKPDAPNRHHDTQDAGLYGQQGFVLPHGMR